MLWPKKIHTRNSITKKNSCRSKIPLPRPTTFLMVRPLSYEFKLSVQRSNHKAICASRDNFKSYPGRSGAVIGHETEWTILQLRDEFYLSRNLWIFLSRIVLIVVLVLVIFKNPRWRQQVAKVSLNITNFDGVVWSLNFRLAIHELFSTAMTLEYFTVKATI